MGSNTSKFSLEQAIGKTSLPRISNATIRGSVRRSNPDGGHASPFFLGLTGKTLIVAVTPVIGDVTINFVSDLMSDTISTINLASPANLKAIDEDGYLRITNLNTGSKNSLKITGGTSTTILGFIVVPEPGSTSFVGEIATSSPGRGQTNIQNNPQGTHLIAQDEDLTSSVINRGIAGSVEHVERLIRDLDREIPVVRKISVTTITLPTTGDRAFVIADPTIRFPVDGFGIAVSNPSVFLLDQLVRLKASPDDTDIYDISQTDPLPHVSKVLYNTGLIGVSDSTQTFTTWGTPDGKSVFGSQLRNKQPPVNITNIRGNVIEASTAAFVTNTIQPGDTLIVESATNNTPFNHNGEYVVTEVLDNTRVAVRAKGSAEKTFITAEIPTELNANLPGGTSYGTARVIVGSYIPATALTFVVPSWITTATTYFVHVYCGVRIRDLQPGDIGVRFSASDEAILSILRTHITTASSFRHHAADIDYAGGPAWRDGVTNPAVTVEAQLDKLVTDLTAATGAIKIGYNGGPAWADSTTNPTTNVEQQLDKIITDLAASTGAVKIGYNGGPPWADGTTNPATTIEAQLDKIVSDLAGATGTGKIQGSVVGTDLAANTLALQIADLATSWLKMSRANTIAGAQTFSALLTSAAITASGLITANAGVSSTTITASGLITAAAITASGLITANAGLTAGSNQNVIISGTGSYKHGEITIAVRPDILDGTFTGNVTATTHHTFIPASPAASMQFQFNTLLGEGKRIKKVKFNFAGDGSGSAEFSWSVAKFNYTTVTATSLDSGLTSPISGFVGGEPTAWTPVSTIALSSTLGADESFVIRVDMILGTAKRVVGPAFVTYDHP